MVIRSIKNVLAIILLSLPFTACAPLPSVGPASDGVVVLDSPDLLVIDGDTFRRERVRIIGIDTPERGGPGYHKAKARLKELLKSGPVTMAPHGRDRYGRTLARVFVSGRDVAAVLKAEGFNKPTPKN